MLIINRCIYDVTYYPVKKIVYLGPRDPLASVYYEYVD